MVLILPFAQLIKCNTVAVRVPTIVAGSAGCKDLVRRAHPSAHKSLLQPVKKQMSEMRSPMAIPSILEPSLVKPLFPFE